MQHAALIQNTNYKLKNCVIILMKKFINSELQKKQKASQLDLKKRFEEGRESIKKAYEEELLKSFQNKVNFHNLARTAQNFKSTKQLKIVDRTGRK